MGDHMNLKKYDNKCIRIIDTDDNIFEGNCIFNSREYNEHEYGMNEDSLQILNISFYKSYIKSIEIIKELKKDEYTMLEELIVDSDKDFLNDALNMCNEIEKERLMLCINNKK
jgi:alanine dehydrogenase